MIRTRIAPSPTGKDVHVGSIATALINYAWAKKNGGSFIVRIEDTDRTRLVEGGEQKMLQTLEELGIHADESPLVGGPHAPYRQSERLGLYKQYAEELIQKGKAYYCTCTPERLDSMRKEQQAQKKIPRYDRFCLHRQVEIKKMIEQGTKYVVRLLMPEQEIRFTDLVRGEIVVQGAHLDDQVLLKSDGFPTYHLGVVVDDHLMQITHVIRGEEWLPSTPKHIVIYQGLGWSLPQFGHVSLLRNPDKSKLSKRKNPVWASDYIEKGILPEALLNYLALMGWSHPEGKEVFDLNEYVQVFDIKDIQTTAPVFDPIKLEWMNGEYIRRMDNEKLSSLLVSFYQQVPRETILKTIPLIKERIKKLADYEPLCRFLFSDVTSYEINLDPHKELLRSIETALENVSDWRALSIGEQMAQTAQKSGLKNAQFFMILRVAITGSKISPPLNESMEILGKEVCLLRVKRALSSIE